MSTNYNDSHRLFLQAMLSKRIVTEREAKSLYSRVCQVVGIEEDIEYPMFISNINKELDTLDYSLRISHNERSGEPYLTLVNVKQDAMTSIATTFTPTEISYIRELLDMIVNADNEDYAISTTTALHLGQKVKPVKLSQKESQDILDHLVEDEWIALSENGVYYLDTRAVSELQGYLREQYGDAIKECTICLDVVTMGECCSISNCPVRLHKYCADCQFRNTSSPSCPQCSARWSRSNTFGLGLEDD